MAAAWRRAVAVAVLGLVGAGVLVVNDVAPAPPPAPTGAAAVAAAPDTATIVIQAGGTAATFSPRSVSVAGGGVVTVVNLDHIDHTVTSVAVDDRGEPLFDVRVRPGSSATLQGAELLGNGSFDFYCTFHPTMRGTLVVEGAAGGVKPSPQAFEQPLLVPSVRREAHVRLPVREARVRVLPRGRRTRMWTYGGSYPGPTIVRRAGHGTKVTFAHRLPRRAGSLTTHLHGDHHAARHDGQPTTRLIRPGRSRTYEYPLTHAGEPAPGSFFFYHDHRMDLTARNNWRGLQGMFLVKDRRSASLRLPTGVRDVPLMLSDRSFTPDNQLTDPFADGPRMSHHHGGMSFTGPAAPPNDATVGTHVLVNGRFAPYLDVTATRHRLRLLNSSSFSAYNLSLSDGRPFLQVGTGNGLLRRPVVRSHITLGPAQRVDVVVDFHGEVGERVVLRSSHDEGAGGTGARDAELMEFRVRRAAPDRSRLPSRLPAPDLVDPPAEVSKTWTFGLDGNTRHGTFWSVNGRAFDPRRVDHRARLGTAERWRLRNTSDMTHYVHIHNEQWRTVLRNGRRPPPWERGLEDTWRLDPGDVVEVAARFVDHVGPFMIHCHMLDHEDHGMMARFDVVR